MSEAPQDSSVLDEPATDAGSTPPKAKAKAVPVARAVKTAPPAAEPPLVAPPASPAPPPPSAPPKKGDAAPPDAEAELAAGDEAAPAKVGAAMSSWLLSLAVHLGLLLLLALWYLPALPEALDALLIAEPSDQVEDFEDVPEISFDQMELEEPMDFELQPDTDVIAEQVDFAIADDASEAPSYTELSALALTTAPPVTPTDLKGFDGSGTSGRGRAARTAVVGRNGGTQSSEEAVGRALRWLQRHQNPDGSWSLVHNRGDCNGRCGNPSNLSERPSGFADSLRSGTGLALLPYLGAGQTHKQGNYRKTVKRGLDALVRLGQIEKKAPGVSWREAKGGAGNMYAHGIAAIALTEAYGMTRDPALKAPAQAAVDYIVYAQGADGGWRYAPKQLGDTSVTGWQIMALKSAHLSELNVPPGTAKGAMKFLDLVQKQNGAGYAYTAEGNPRPTLNAVGLLCRMYLGWGAEKKPLINGVADLAKRGPSENDYYRNYYAAQVIFQHTGGRGRLWREFNRDLRDQLIAQQVKKGHAEGSWYVEGVHNDRGGRIYMTSLATMCLEVYYRYMPIYQAEAVSSEFPQ
ncbi:MAG: prenyltransferase/squalene oxidase repeat-containing protein [Planctomycetota bacterium]